MPTPITHENLGKGMDQFHPESRIPDGYWQDSLNGDPTPEGTLRTRKGYQRYAGSVPIRATSVSRSGTNLDISVDASFDLSALRSTPIIVYGRLSSAQTGDFSTTTAYKYYSSFTISSGKIRVTDSASGSYSDSAPQLVVYGIDWSTDIRAAGAGDRWGWVNHIDTYRSSLETRVVCGLGGNFFASYTYDESNAAVGMPRLYPSIRGTVSGARVLGPAFVSAAGSRTRGDISTTGVAGGYVQCTAAAYNSGTGYVDFILSLPTMAVNGTLSTIIAADGDWLSVRDMPSALNGTWLIHGVVQGTDQLTISCAVDDVSDTRYDVSGADGDAGVFTDKLVLSAAAKFDPGDRIDSTHLPAATVGAEVYGVSGTSIYVGILANTTYSVSDTEVLYGTRSSRCVYTRDSGGTAGVTNAVRGDMLEIVGFTRRIRVVNINAAADRTVDIAVSAGVATATITAGSNTTSLATGDILRLRGAGVHNGDVEITAIGSSTQFSWETDETATVTGATCAGGTLGLDEEIELADDSANTTYLQPHARWIPLEWPTPITAYVPQTRVRHLNQQDYDDQLFVRSAMAQDNMYLADGVHPMMKFDGTSLVLAGLPRWQPHFFTLPMPSTYRREYIPANEASISVTGTAASTAYTCTAGQEAKVATGDFVVLQYGTGSLQQYFGTVLSTASGSIELTVAAPSSTTYTIRHVQSYRYYTRLSMLDSNNNIIASAQTSSQDMAIIFGAPTYIEHRLCPFLRLGGYDFTRLDLQLYRTAEGAAPPYFRHSSVPMTFGAGRNYVALRDTTPSELMVDESGAEVGQLDPVASALVGDELGTAWDQPPIAKYLTSVGGRLVGANIVDFEQLNLVFRVPTSNPTAVFPTKSLHGKRIYLRRNGATSTTPDMADVMGYEMVCYATAFSGSQMAGVTGVDVASDGSTFTIKSSASGPTPVAGNWIQIVAYDGGTSGVVGDWPVLGWFQVSSITTISAQNYTTCRCSLPAPLAFTHTDVSAASDTITITGHGLQTGDRATLATTATPPGGLAAVTNYWVIRTDADTIKLATSLANAQAGTAINITSTGTGPFRLLQGAYANLSVIGASNLAFVPVFTVEIDDAGVGYNDQAGYNTRSDHFHTSSGKELQFPRKLMHAINASMSNFDVVQYPSFEPWLLAYAGNDCGPGQLIIRRLDVDAEAATVEHDITATALEVYESGVQLAVSTRKSATQRVFPSRLCRSYQNYPEIFDAPYAFSSQDSDSIIDVNPNDGDEVVGCANLFGESSFSQSANESVVIAAKKRSMYAVNIETRQWQQINTEGRGCEYPRSLRTTPDGVTFANRDGLWLVNRAMKVVPIGKYMSRKWRDAVQHDADPDLVCGIFADSKWLVSVPVASETGCDEVYVVDTLEADDGSPRAAWTRYDNFPATGWTTAGRDVVFGTTAGTVCSRRRAGDETDYRDDAEAIEQDWLYKPVNFGSGGLRKQVHSVSVAFRVATGTDDVAVSFATDTVASYRAADTFELVDASDLQPTDVDTGIDDRERAIVRTIRFKPPVRKANYQQIRIQCSAIDTPVEVVQFDWYVDPLTDAGVETASQTRNPGR